MNPGIWSNSGSSASWSESRWSRPDEGADDSSDERLRSLRKAIREQHILLSALDAEEEQEGSYDDNLDKIKDRISSISRELRGQTSLIGSSFRASVASRWEKYQSNLRKLETISDQTQALTKEIRYLADVSENTKSMLVEETINLNQAELALARTKSNIPTEIMTEEDRIKAKVQAMIAMRLNGKVEAKEECTLVEAQNGRKRLEEIERLANEIEQCSKEVDRAVNNGFCGIEEHIKDSQKLLRERQMFEEGLFVSDEVARFIDEIAITADSPSPPSSLPIPVIVAPPQATIPAPPVPVTQRPGSPRSADDIKAEAHRRIEERRRLFISKHKRSVEFDTRKSETPPQQRNNGIEETPEERQRRIEAEAKKRLELLREKRIKMRQEAAQEEERRKKAAAEAAAVAEAEMLEEKRLKHLEEDERREKQRQLGLAEAERVRKEQEEREREIAQKREDEERLIEETRQRKARLAAEKAAKEKRLRQEETERREREIEAARLEELRRRIAWEEEEAKKTREAEEEDKKRKEMLEDAETKKRVDEQGPLQNEELISDNKSEKDERPSSTEIAEDQPSQDPASSQTPSPVQQHSPATAGTSGYGVDIEDEVDFGTIYRVKTLYEYRGAREDDLSFADDEIIKAHPSKDEASDWWYGTSLSTHCVGFFPRTYVEIIEQAFRVRTLYKFRKAREDDLGFAENEIIVVQPFQDEDSEWWYGTNEDTLEYGYFPISYVKVIDADSADMPHDDPSTSTSTSTNGVAIPKKSSGLLSAIESDTTRGLSAPNTPVLKKTTLGQTKQSVSRRRRAASNASTSGNSAVISPGLQRQDSDLQLNIPTMTTWTSIMDEQELAKIPVDERNRQEAIYELISTERTYLRDLQLIINVFYVDSSKYLSREEQDVVFSNIDDLLLCNTALLSDFESRQREDTNVVSTIGDVFLKHANNLKAYSTFCRNQSFASRFLQKKRDEDQWFEVFLKTAQTRPECRSLDLSHFLLEPVQRITRYPLLLRQILKSTPEKHADRGLIKSALTRAEKVLDDVNEETRRYENRQKMSELSRILDMEEYGKLDTRGRDFVMEGILYKAKSGRKLHCYLFSDILLLAEPLKSLNSKGYLYRLYREPMNIERVSVRPQHNMSLKQTFTSSTENTSLQIVYGNQVIAIKTPSTSQKLEWISQIQHYSALQMTMRH